MQQPERVAAFESLPDLAVRSAGGSVIAANDETFAERKPHHGSGPHVHRIHVWSQGSGDGRLGDPPTSGARSRLGARAARAAGHAARCRRRHRLLHRELPVRVFARGDVRRPAGPPARPACARRRPERRLARGGAALCTAWQRPARSRCGERAACTHVRLRIFPDGGVARLRVHGEPIGDPRWVATRPFDLAALEYGARVLEASNRFYSDPANALAAGPARLVMGEGWRPPAVATTPPTTGSSFALVAEDVRPTGRGRTSHFIGNAPGEIRVRGRRVAGEWVDLVAHSPAPADTRHRFLVADQVPVDTLRLDIYPDGGLARLRAVGAPTPEGRAALFARWFDRLSPAQALSALREFLDADESWADLLVAARPLTDAAGVAVAMAKAAAGGPSPRSAPGSRATRLMTDFQGS